MGSTTQGFGLQPLNLFIKHVPIRFISVLHWSFPDPAYVFFRILYMVILRS
jgi:hypothetical protein